ncbi:MAG: lipid A biosynthesis acyltransferase [Sphaerobacteraceae bacterium]|nr:MAG: lipid A biosynthesis acyltransferase [Sphaerobacteraceae bacterium]
MWLLRILKLVAILTPLIPASIGYALCSVVGTAFFLVNGTARSNVMANLDQVLPGASRAHKLRTARRVCETVVTNYYDLLRIRSIDRDRISDKVEIEGLEHIYQALEAGRGAIIVSGHIGNFSVMAKLPSTLGLTAGIIAERVEPPELFNYMVRLRSAMGIEVIPPDAGSLRKILDLLNRNGILLLAADRDVTNQGLPVHLFGEETRLPSGPVVLAMRTGARLIPASTYRRQDGTSAVHLNPPIELIDSGDRASDVRLNLQIVADHLESMIAVDPGQWGVLQRIWPPQTTYGRSEGIGSGETADCRTGGNRFSREH